MNPGKREGGMEGGRDGGKKGSKEKSTRNFIIYKSAFHKSQVQQIKRIKRKD